MRERERQADLLHENDALVASRRPVLAKELAEQLEVPLLGNIPLVPELREGGDDGHPIAAKPDTEAGAMFLALAERLDTELAPKRRYRSELRVI